MMATREPGWPSIDPGRMIHKVTFLDQQTITDISGTVVQWVPINPPVWAEINEIGGREVLRAGQDTTQSYSEIKVWWQSWIKAAMRVREEPNGPTRIIQSIQNIGKRNVGLVLNCVALSANQ